MTDRPSFFKNANTNFHALFILSALAMIGFSLYLTGHYFDVMFPQGLGASTICDINSFLNCDVATFSPLSNIMGVPISVMGLMVGIVLLLGYMISSPAMESTLHWLLRINLLGCVVLLIYSLIFLGGLCPFCALYYLSSAGAWFAFHKNSKQLTPGAGPIAIVAVLFLAAAGITYGVVDGKEKERSARAQDLIRQFNTLQKLGNPSPDSPYLIASASEKFEDAPIRISKFSDFQCPACKMLSENLHKIAKRYPGKVSIQYYFYPLDSSCNPNMQRPMHQLACAASYLAACLPNKFAEVEEKIFANQNDLSAEWIKRYAKDEGVSDCVAAEETKTKVQQLISAAAPFNVESTPTFILNGVKIVGALPLQNMFLLIDEILKEQKK
jgi:protein-disulfide isomerase/uncharacterized membrane protein